jgi:hypothetical protein
VTELPKPKTTPAEATLLHAPEPAAKPDLSAPAKPVTPPLPPRKQHVTRVKSHGTLKFFNKMDPEERKAWMKGGGALEQLRERRRMVHEASKQMTIKFCTERDVVLRALNVEKMEEFYRNWQQPLPEKYVDPSVPYAMMHKARLHINSFTEEEKETSRNWLRANGYSEGLKLTKEEEHGN